MASAQDIGILREFAVEFRELAMGVVNRRILEEDCARGDSSSTRPNPARKRPYEWPETARQTGGPIKTGVNRAPEDPPVAVVVGRFGAF